jgi:hypothetical protein
MIRLELILAIGIGIGFILGIAFSRAAQVWLHYRDEQARKKITKILLKESLPSIATTELLNEISKRDDILR